MTLEKRGGRRRRPPEILTAEECGRLLAACGRGVSGIRNRALVIVLWRGGLRISEALELRAVDLARDVGELRVLHGKGDVDRTVFMDPMAWALLDPWLRRRRQFPRPHAGPLFCTISDGAQGRKLSSSYVRQALARAAARAGISKAVRPHGLRHTCAVNMAREGIPVNLIRRQLGHRSLSTTSRYIDHLAAGELAEAMRRRAWPAAAAPPSS